ncbi:MAG: L,D-transpeptidase family protein, partial [Selenomonadaceae bacterium]|nr:L,D-transpeptidase family protein [Selenomonadaceae bacterium]
MNALKFFVAIILILSSFAAPAYAQKKIYINAASRLMLFYDDDTKLAVYHLGLGKVETPTPTGYYKITSKEINPPWIDPSDPEYEIPSGPDNPLGYRWMQFSGNYGIHGTNRPESIGGYVSNGCIRMNERDVEELFDAVEVGTPVEITYNRVVVEKSPDGDVVYYIYPDGYGMQIITVADVAKWL